MYVQHFAKVRDGRNVSYNGRIVVVTGEKIANKIRHMLVRDREHLGRVKDGNTVICIQHEGASVCGFRRRRQGPFEDKSGCYGVQLTGSKCVGTGVGSGSRVGRTLLAACKELRDRWSATTFLKPGT